MAVNYYRTRNPHSTTHFSDDQLLVESNYPTTSISTPEMIVSIWADYVYSATNKVDTELTA